MNHPRRPIAILIVTFLSLLFLSAARADYSHHERQDDELTLAEGTALNVVTTDEIPSKTAGPGAAINFKVYDDVLVNGHIVIKKGTAVKGSIINGEKSGLKRKSGRLGIQIESTQTVDGQPVRLRALESNEGNANNLNTAPFTVVSGLFLLREGGDAKIAEGARLTVCVAEEKYFRVDDSTLVAIFPPAKVAAAAARKAPAGPGSEGFAIVYVYRPNKWAGKLREFSVVCDGIAVAHMDNGSYFSLKLEPGKHILHMADLNQGYVINMHAGQIYYFRVGLVTWKAEDELTLEDAEKAIPEIRKLKFVRPDRIKDRIRVVELPLSEIKP